MLTHHGARDLKTGDVTRTAAHITKVGLDSDGNGTFEADVVDTEAGRDIAALTTPDQPYLKGVSMASVWKGTPTLVRGPDGLPCETADGFSLMGIDFTHNPGIVGAEISSAELAEASATGLIYESIEGDVFVEPEDVTVKEAFADPGYLEAGKQLPIGTPADIRTSWVQSHRKSVTEAYTPKQVARIRSKVKGAAKKAGFDIVAETSLFGSEILEAYTSVCVDNGPADMRVSAYVDDPSNLQAVTQRVALAALSALQALDPDNDGDIDLGESDDDAMESAPCPGCGADIPFGALYCPSCGQPVPQAESAPAGSTLTESESTVTTSTETTGAATESTLSFTQTQLDEAVATQVAAALEAAGVKPTEVVEESADLVAARKLIAEADAGTETTPVAPVVAEATTFTAEQVKTMVTEAAETAAKSATEAALDLARKEIQEAGPRRRGLIPKSIMEQSPEEIYGDTPMAAASTQELERLTDVAMMPLISR
jgi:hypothetical protein